MDVFAEGKDIYCASASQMFHVPVEKHGINSHLRQKGKIAELALGYGGSVGALKAMGALEMGLQEEELQPLVDAWRSSNPNITAFWWAIDAAVKQAVIYKTSADTHGFHIYYQGGMLFIDLPSGRRLSYVKPRMGVNQFSSKSVTYEGTTTGKWGRIESYGPKFVENIVQAVSRDILAYAMQTLSHCFICGHVHDELIIECSPDVSWMLSSNRWGEPLPGSRDCFLEQTGMNVIFIRKIKPIKLRKGIGQFDLTDAFSFAHFIFYLLFIRDKCISKVTLSITDCFFHIGACLSEPKHRCSHCIFFF